MKRAGRFQSTIVGASLAAVVLGTSGLVTAATAVANTPMTATTWVNMRSGPSSSNPVLGVLSPSETVQSSGTVTNGWHQVTTSKGVKGWVYKSYLQAGSNRESAPAGGSTASGQATTNAAVNVRTGPGLSYSVVAVAARGTTLPTTGKTSGGWTEVIHGGAARWISTNYLGGSGSPAPAPTSPRLPAPPESKGTAYVTVAALNVRATSASNGAVVGTVYRGAELPTTGVVENGRLQILHQGVARWVYRAYTSAAAPVSSYASSSVSMSGISQLNANGKAVVDHVLANYPQIRAIYGWRASSAISTSDHPHGRAVDIMVSNWSRQESIDYGNRIARDFQANASKYKVSYIIWRQQIWNASYPDRGWRQMEDRGGATANHYDHVHVSVRP